LNPPKKIRCSVFVARPGITTSVTGEGFQLECLALERVREQMGLVNVKAMIPFCRTVEEAQRVR